MFVDSNGEELILSGSSAGYVTVTKNGQTYYGQIFSKCCCNQAPHYRTFDVQYFTDPIPELNLNDRFPEEACEGEKGILFMNDATVYVEYHSEDRWKLVEIAEGGIKPDIDL